VIFILFFAAQASLPAVPVMMEASGLFAVDFKLYVSCRDACIYSIKRGFKTSKFVRQFLSSAAGMIIVNGNIVVGCMDKSLSCCSSKGVSLWNISLPAMITAMAPIEVEMLGHKLVAVALASKQVLIFHDKHKVDMIQTHEVVNCMKYGKYGRESGTLVLVSQSGSLTIRILKRSVKFYPKEASSSQGQSAVTKLILPKKTKLFVDQTMRERNECQSKHSSCSL
jgi:Bardet-Biedl syndrome 1 protein